MLWNYILTTSLKTKEELVATAGFPWAVGPPFTGPMSTAEPRQLLQTLASSPRAQESCWPRGQHGERRVFQTVHECPTRLVGCHADGNQSSISELNQWSPVQCHNICIPLEIDSHWFWEGISVSRLQEFTWILEHGSLCLVQTLLKWSKRCFFCLLDNENPPFLWWKRLYGADIF